MKTLPVPQVSINCCCSFSGVSVNQKKSWMRDNCAFYFHGILRHPPLLVLCSSLVFLLSVLLTSCKTSHVVRLFFFPSRVLYSFLVVGFREEKKNRKQQKPSLNWKGCILSLTYLEFSRVIFPTRAPCPCSPLLKPLSMWKLFCVSYFLRLWRWWWRGRGGRSWGCCWGNGQSSQIKATREWSERILWWGWWKLPYLPQHV